MGTLLFVGAGLSDEEGLPRRSVVELSSCDAVFAEEYTATLAPGSLERLAAVLSRPVIRLEREDVERPEAILAALRRSARVGFLTAGDPFAATTHVALRLAAEREGHEWSYWPNASVVTAAPGLLGLQAYRFGRTTSLPFPTPGFAPTSPLETIGANRADGLHSLVLLDLRPSDRRFMTANEALALFDERDPSGRWVPSDALVAVVARVGTPSADAWVGRRTELRSADFGPPLHCLVVPGPRLHFEEEAAVDRFRWPRTNR